MELTLKREVVAALTKAGCKSPILTDGDAGFRGLEIDTRALVPKDLPIMRKVLSTEPFSTFPENRRVLRQLDALEAIASGTVKDMKLKNLESLPDILRAQIAPTKRKWLFRTHKSFGIPVPWFVTGISYTPPKKERDSYSPAYVQMNVSAMIRGHECKESIYFHRVDLKVTAQELLDGAKCLLETRDLMAEYEKSMKKYRELADGTGAQYLARGVALEGGSSWSRGDVAMEKDGVPTKVIMDDVLGEDNDDSRGTDSGYDSTKFWSKDYHGDEDEEGEDAFALPIHPIVRIFNLREHEYEQTHIDNLEPYPYDTKMGEKLILPPDHKELIDALTNRAIARMDDIVQGKATGIILLCSGKPGTGKTLTAEVYSEVAKMPLYIVQCSQLGTSSDELEKLLSVVLTRATRWGALLLIDEADVYIHERGDDLDQNAIVGVFLRLLEYYSGILFMTTNRDTITDDAILSRVTAHVRYDVPDGEKAVELWRVLSEQYGLQNLVPKECAKAFPGISGRSVRSLLKLAAIMGTARGCRVTVELLKWAAKYQDFTEKEGDGK